MLLMIDNYDSFTYNLVHYFDMLAEEVVVVRNDALTTADIIQMKPSRIVISPGPCTPNETGICMDVIATLAGKVPILGICLGHQTIAQHYGGRVVRSQQPVHGKVFPITHDGRGLFRNLPSPFNVTRYHSLEVERATLPSCLEITATTEDGTIMGLRHRTHPIESVQFHPEAILTQYGHEILRNFLSEV